MNESVDFVAGAIILFSAVMLFLLARRIQEGHRIGLRPLAGYASLTKQTGRAVESGRSVHVALGQGSLAGRANPTSLASLAALDYLAQDGCPSDVPPLVTAGDGTLLLAGQDSLRGAYAAAGRRGDFKPGMVQFVADQAFPLAYAAGVTEAIQHQNVGSNVLLGRFGPELAVMAEAAGRKNMEQVIGSDEPVALAIGLTVTNNLLIGEEFLAAGAYLQGRPVQVASLQLQDILRYLAAGSVLLAAVYRLVVG